MKKLIVILALGALSASLAADSVRLTDGSSLSGKVVEQANGDLVVTTGAGDITVPKAKVSAIVADSKSVMAEEGDMTYVNEVERRRKKFGNNDGIPRTSNLQKNQLFIGVGLLNYTGDAFLRPGLNMSDIAGMSYGLAYAYSFSDYVALETWGDFSASAKDYSVPGGTDSIRLQRFDLGIGPKVQKAIALGEPEQSLMLIPNIGISPIWSSAAGMSKVGGLETSFYSSSIGASLNGGLDFQFGGALISAKLRYLLTTDVTGAASFNGRNTSAWMPQIGVGFSF